MESESEGSDAVEDGSNVESEEESGDDSSDDGEVERYSGRGTAPHEAAFGDHTNISVWLRNKIDMLRDDHPDLTSCSLDPGWHYPNPEGTNDARVLGGSALELLGKYVANNTHVLELSIGVPLTDAAALFRGLTKSDTINTIYLSDCGAGINFIRSMMPFLQNSPELQSISVDNEQNFGTECFELLANALGGERIKRLYLYQNNVRDVTSLEQFTHLVDLCLGDINIGYPGSEIVSNILRRDDCVLEDLGLNSTGMGPEGVELIINSLGVNTTLHRLRLDGNQISKSGAILLLHILNDISSIESTLNSNCTLRELRSPQPRPDCVDRMEIHRILRKAEDMVYINYDDWNAAGRPKGTGWQNTRRLLGREKVIKTQLLSRKREELCNIQGIEYSHGSIFAGIQSEVLPDLIALVGQQNGQTDLYRMLLSTSSDLICLIDREKMLKDTMKKVESRFKAVSWEYSNITFKFTQESSALATKFFELSERLVEMKAVGKSPQARNWQKSMEEHMEQKRKMEDNAKQLESGALEFSHKHAELTGQISGMMSDLTNDFPGLSRKKRKRSLSI